ncbi:SRPBCC family protein [Micromonospora sp. WMMD1102]|uniref:SRPBCC family protein n=1 Tax=Micromonospora sp. WMMD1102 TaxID=3016105 RepID=UPI00241536AC|nr:SRPBCC family protein [Micromonospora sp. WMMD1102]MDG4787326.1 SRPBCC family protein [Micromonospora sp. WMMD1102]
MPDGELEMPDVGRQLLPRALGVLSLGLGVAALAVPARLAGLTGVDERVPAGVLRAIGARELVPAPGLLFAPRPAGWAWVRVAGDALDLLLLARALPRRRDERRRRVTATLAAVAAITAVDLLAAVRAGRSAGARRRAVRASATVTVNRPADEVYRFWRDFENLPRFMYHLESVRAGDGGRSHWTARAPGGRRVGWDAELVEDTLGEAIAWRSVRGARVPNAGRVRLRRAAGGRGTEVRVDLVYAPPGGAVGRMVAKLFGEEPGQQVRDDLRRFKQVVETGEVVRSDGSPAGLATRQQVLQRPARPQPADPPR